VVNVDFVLRVSGYGRKRLTTNCARVMLIFEHLVQFLSPQTILAFDVLCPNILFVRVIPSGHPLACFFRVLFPPNALSLAAFFDAFVRHHVTSA
jgi:hypothetical protein